MNATPNPVNEINTETHGVQNSSGDSKNRTLFRVYALCDPRTPAVPRYIGMSSNLIWRAAKHRNRPNSKAARAWFAELAKEFLQPCMTVLHEFDTEEQALSKERELIATLPDLINGRHTEPVEIPEIIPATMLNESLATVEARHILAMLKKCDGNMLETSRRLKIGRQTLYNKLAKLTR